MEKTVASLDLEKALVAILTGDRQIDSVTERETVLIKNVNTLLNRWHGGRSSSVASSRQPAPPISVLVVIYGLERGREVYRPAGVMCDMTRTNADDSMITFNEEHIGNNNNNTVVRVSLNLSTIMNKYKALFNKIIDGEPQRTDPAYQLNFSNPHSSLSAMSVSHVLWRSVVYPVGPDYDYSLNTDATAPNAYKGVELLKTQFIKRFNRLVEITKEIYLAESTLTTTTTATIDEICDNDFMNTL